MKLESKNVAITGAGRGIGEAIAYALAREGANISLTARTVSELEKVEKKVKEFGVKTFFQKCDVSKQEEVEGWIDKTHKELGGTDIMINNAGMYGPIGLFKDNDINLWSHAIQTNLLGTVFCIKAVLPQMIQRKEGVIINLSGGGALMPFPRFTAYGASKAAIVRLTETLSEELKEYNIRVNAIAPGGVNTRLLDEALQQGEIALGKEHYENFRKQKEQGGAPPEKAAELAVFLASDESKGLTGKVISAVWDDWKNIPSRIVDFKGTPLYTMRRIDGQNFKEVK